MAIELEKIIPGDGAQTVADKIYNNDLKNATSADSALEEALSKAPKVNANGDKVVYSPSGVIEIYQKIDDTNDKAISPKGVKDGILDIDGIEYDSETAEGGFDSENLAADVEYISGYFLNINGGGKPSGNANYGYCATFIKVNPGERYFFSGDRTYIVCYSAADENTYLGYAGRGSGYTCTIPANCNYVRFDYALPLRIGGYFLQRFTEETITISDNLIIALNLENIKGAIPSAFETEPAGVFTKNTQIIPGGIEPDNSDGRLPNIRWHTDYASIKPNTSYTCNLNHPEPNHPLLYFYDKDKKPLYFITLTANIRAFTTLRNVAFVRMNLGNPVLGGANIFEASQTQTNYVIPNLVVPENMIVKDTSRFEVVEAIPAPNMNITNSITQNNWYGYKLQSTIQGKHITTIVVKSQSSSLLTVGFCPTLGGSSLSWAKDFNLVAGENTLKIDKVLPNSEYLQIKGSSIAYYTGAANPVGGIINNINNTDLCVVVNIYSSEEVGVSSKEYISIGDSITYGDPAAYTPYGVLLADEYDLSFTNLSIGGLAVFNGGFLNYVNMVPQGFTGLITTLIGVNDAGDNGAGSPLGTAADALAKSEAGLVSNNTFAEAFRLAILTLLKRAPLATIVVMMPLKTWATRESTLINYRNVEREIANYYAIPVVELDKICGIAPNNYSTVMPDSLHPNNTGHEMIARILMGELSRFFRFK